MKRKKSTRSDEIPKGFPLEDKYAYISIEYNQSLISLDCLIKTIKAGGEKILEMTDVEKEPGGTRIVVMKLETQDVRNAILNLSRHSLISVEGYSSKPGLVEK